MDVQVILAVIFLIFVLIFLYLKRKELIIQKFLFPLFYLIMYKTKVGLSFMEKAAKKFPRFLRFFSYSGIVVGFIGMVLISYMLVKNVVDIIITQVAPPGVGLVLPIPIKGVFYVPFFYWIISIFILAVIHEFAHGVVAKHWGLKVKSSGLAILGVLVPIIPVAFVEPDEKKIRKRPLKEQLSIFAAGPFSNVLAAGIVLCILLWGIWPVAEQIVESRGIYIKEVLNGENVTYPAEAAGMQGNELIVQMDDVEIETYEDFAGFLSKKKPNDQITVVTNISSYELTLAQHPDNESASYMGVLPDITDIAVKPELRERYWYLPDIFIWFTELFEWLFFLNLGIGLFNLVPVAIVDGGRMFQLILLRYLKKKTANKIFSIVSTFFLLSIAVILIMGFL